MTLPLWFGASSDDDRDTLHVPRTPAARRLHVVREEQGADDTGDEPRLFADAVAGDWAAFAALHRAYYPKLLRFARRFVPSRDDAEDVVQHVFTTLWVRRAYVAPAAPPGPYLFGAVRYRALTHRTRFRMSESPASQHSDSADSAPPRVIAEVELRATLDTAIAALPERQRAALILWWVEEMGYTDVGEALGISHVAARKLVIKALERLRPLLDPA